MQILTSHNWSDYQLVDSGNGQRLEKFGKYLLIRPDPQIIWKPSLPESEWKKADAIFQRTSADQGKWNIKTSVPKQWLLKYNKLTFVCKLTPFKHTGVFPEQSSHWDFIQEKIEQSNRSINVLNLFGYSGIASLAAAESGAKVTHVDASYQAIGWARENQKLSNLEGKEIRWILDDAIKFVQREIRRGKKYEAILMDPPIYGHGPKGEKWQFNSSFPELLEMCKMILSEEPLFVLVNAYAISASSLMLENVFRDYFSKLGGSIDCGELVLKESSGNRLLSTGIFARWYK